MNEVFVAGASSQIGRFLLPQLIESGYRVTAVSRRMPTEASPAHWLQADIAHQRLNELVNAETVVVLAPLGVLVDALSHGHMPRVRRLVAFSSTGAFTKRSSTDRRDQIAAERLLEAESAFRRQCDAHSIASTLFRPTMIYDGISDKNVALIAGFIRRFGFFPLIGTAGGLRQPVHAADLAQACCLALENELTFGKTYNLGGRDVLSYRDMVTQIFFALGRKPHFVPVPQALLKAGLTCARYLPKYRYLNASMAERMSQDMVFDWSAATRDFGYNPRGFSPAFGS